MTLYKTILNKTLCTCISLHKTVINETSPISHVYTFPFQYTFIVISIISLEKKNRKKKTVINETSPISHVYISISIHIHCHLHYFIGKKYGKKINMPGIQCLH